MSVVLEYLKYLVDSAKGGVVCLRFSGFIRWCTSRHYDCDRYHTEFYRWRKLLDRYCRRVVHDKYCYDVKDVRKFIFKVAIAE